MRNLFRGPLQQPGQLWKGSSAKGFLRGCRQINNWNRSSGKSLMVCHQHDFKGGPLMKNFAAAPSPQQGKPKGQMSVQLIQPLCEGALSSVFWARVSFLTCRKRPALALAPSRRAPTCGPPASARGRALASACSLHPPGTTQTHSNCHACRLSAIWDASLVPARSVGNENSTHL